MPRSHAGPHRREDLGAIRAPVQPERRPATGRGNQAALEDRGLSGGGATAVSEPWVRELLDVAPIEGGDGGGRWASVRERARLAGQGDPVAPGDGSPPQDGVGSGLSARLAAIEARLMTGDVAGVSDAASALATEARALLAAGKGDSASLNALISAAGELWTQARAQQGKQLGITDRGRADMDRMASAASKPWYSAPMGKCYRAVAGFDSSSYVNRAGGRWKQLADRIPSSHGMWAVSFAHWLQETSHGQRAARELGFEIRESDGKTRLGDYLARHPELKGSIVVIPYGQEGTASREWNAAANYGSAKWGAGVGDISVVTAIGQRGATYVADGKVPHDNATMWWVVYPK